MHIAASQPGEPLLHAFAAGGGDKNNFNMRIDLAGAGRAPLNVEIEIRQQVDFVEQHQAGGGEHMRILQRFVFAFGDRQHRHLMALAEIKAGRADRVADVFDKQNAAVSQRQARAASAIIWASRWQPFPVLT